MPTNDVDFSYTGQALLEQAKQPARGAAALAKSKSKKSHATKKVNNFRAERRRLLKQRRLTRKIELLAKTDGLCWYCKAELKPDGNLTKEHLVPRASRNQEGPKGVVPCCARINSMLGDLPYRVKCEIKNSAELEGSCWCQQPVMLQLIRQAHQDRASSARSPT